MKQLLLLPFVLLFVLACSHKKQGQQLNSIQEINIRQALEQNTQVNISNFTEDEIEYVPLESKKEYLLGNNANSYATETEIIAFAKRQIFVFERKTGKFLREIGHYGKDPGGYKKVVQTFPFDEEKQLVYTSGWDTKSYYRYNANGRLLDKVIAYSLDKEGDVMDNIFGEIVTSIAPLNDTCFVGYVWNIDGKQEAKLIVFNENNHRIKIYPQYKRFDFDIKRDGISVFSWDTKYYKLNQQLHFFERFTDTIFTVSMDTLLPRFVFNQNISNNSQQSDFIKSKGIKPYCTIENLFESNRYLFFKIRVGQTSEESEHYYGFYDKEESSTKVSTSESGITNDIENFIPLKFHTSNNNNEIVGSLEAYEVKLWFSENTEKAAKLPPHLQKLKNIKESDNPVVMIAKLKN